MTSKKLMKLIVLALMGTISLILFFISFPLPVLPDYLKVDFSDVPALIMSFVFSPAAGVLVIAIKNGLYLLISGSAEPVGVTANFLAGTLFVVPVSFFYHKYKHKGIKGIIAGLGVSTIITAFGMSILNYFLILPAYGFFMGWEMTQQFKWISVVAGILPFNLIKGLIVSALFIPLYIKMRHWIEQQQSKLA